MHPWTTSVWRQERLRPKSTNWLSASLPRSDHIRPCRLFSLDGAVKAEKTAKYRRRYRESMVLLASRMCESTLAARVFRTLHGQAVAMAGTGRESDANRLATTSTRTEWRACHKCSAYGGPQSTVLRSPPSALPSSAGTQKWCHL